MSKEKLLRTRLPIKMQYTRNTNYSIDLEVKGTLPTLETFVDLEEKGDIFTYNRKIGEGTTYAGLHWY